MPTKLPGNLLESLGGNQTLIGGYDSNLTETAEANFVQTNSGPLIPVGWMVRNPYSYLQLGSFPTPERLFGVGS